MPTSPAAPPSLRAPLARLLGTLARVAAPLAALALVLLVAGDARAAGAFKLKTTEVNEVSGGWHLFATIELPRAPALAHQPMRFVFTQLAVYERSLVDGRSEPVNSRQTIANAGPTYESLDVDFADSSGRIFKGTRFDFHLTRTRGYVAGEYKVELRTSDGVTIGSSQTLTLKGENEVVDRRSIAFNAKDSKIKKVDDGVDAGTPAKGPDVTPAAGGNGEVQAAGTPDSFIPKEGFEKTPEEDMKVKPNSGCGCEVAGASAPAGRAGAGLGLGLGLAAIVVARRRRRAA